MKIFALFWNLDGRPNRVYATSFILRQSRQSVANGARRGEHNRAKHGDEAAEIEVKMRGRGHSGGWVSSLTLAIFAVSVIGLGSPTGAQAHASPAWPQCGQNPRYTGVLAVTGQALQEKLSDQIFSAAGGDNLPTRPEHGVVLARINPFGTTVDPTKFVASGLTADPAGNIYYNAIQLNLSSPWNGENLNLLTAKALIVVGVGKNR
jgi:hypothetical protein